MNNICNVCGANLVYKDGKWLCPACGAYRQEEISNEEVTLLYNASQKLRLASFDEAEELYTDIIKKYPSNSEGYWGLLLSKYSIKYEEDYDGKKLPTCYATSIESVLDDVNYLNAIKFCKDSHQKTYYIEQGKVLERIRREWCEKASKEPQYDVFLCFKDSDKENNIDRTDDSIEVANLYTELSSLGYKVFFSRESLRDKVAEKYEPYIYNAINTAPIMIVYGSKKEYFESVWMKNEWTRFIKRLRGGQRIEGSLIVACDGVNPAELPKPLNMMQVLDARKKTFYGDIEKHIAKIISVARKPKVAIEKIEIKSVKGKTKSSVSDIRLDTREIGLYKVPELTADAEIKLKTAKRYISNEMFDNAQTIVDELLSQNRENGQLLLLSLFDELKVKNIDELLKKISSYSDTDKIKKVIENNEKDIGEQIVKYISELILFTINEKPRIFDTWFDVICNYNFSGRDEWLDGLLEKVFQIANIEKREELFGKIVLYIDGENVTKHISLRLSFAKKFHNGNTNEAPNYVLAKKYYNDVLSIEEGNIEALWNIVLCDVKAREFTEVSKHIMDFTDFEDFEKLLKYSNAEERIDYLSKMVSSVLVCTKGNIDKNYKKVEKIFEQFIKYCPESRNDLLISWAFDFAETCKINEAFDIAEKYYALVLGFDNLRHDAYWGLLQTKLKCRNNDDLIHQNVVISKEKEFTSAIAAAGNDDRSADKYVRVAKNQSDYLEKQAIRARIRKKRRKITTILVSLCAVIIASASAIVGYMNYRQSESILKYTEIEGGYSVCIGKYYFESDVVIPSTYNGKKVISIDANAFNNNINIRKLTLTSNIIEIRDYAFSGCVNLEEINFTLANNNSLYSTINSNEIMSSYSNVLYSNTSFSKIEKIGIGAFSNCLSLNSIDVCNAISIESEAFSACANLNSIILCDNLTTLKEKTFDGCISLKSIDLPTNLTTIEKQCFANCISLQSLTIPEKTTIVGEEIACGCNKLTNIVIEARSGDLSGFNANWKNGLPSNVKVKTGFKIGLNYNGATGGNSKNYFSVSLNESYTLPVPVKAGFTFLGWYDCREGGNKLTNELGSSLVVYNIEQSIAVYAQWQANLNEIIFNNNGGKGEMQSQFIASYAKDYLSECLFTKEGYHFIGWGVDPENISYRDKAEYSMGINSKYVLYAIWDPNVNTLLFDGNGATDGEMSSMSIKTDQSRELPKNSFSRIGYDFIGWGTEMDGEQVYADMDNFKMDSKSENTLYAIWKIHVYSITYDLNDENSAIKAKYNGENPLTYTIDDNIIFGSPTRDGYAFISWDVPAITKGTVGDKIITANWQANSNIIHFNGNGATSGEMQDMMIKTDESKVLPKNEFEKIGYSFEGWSITQDGTKVYDNVGDFFCGINSEYTLYAIWSCSYIRVDENNNKDEQGEYLLFGTYPQSDVTASMGDILKTYVSIKPNAENSNGWISYNYYIKNSNKVDFMWYKDVVYNNAKYRAVYFTNYRPYWCAQNSTLNASYQDDNGYYCSNVYWFRFDEIKWRILSEQEGKATILAELILDSQQFDFDGECSSNYENSTIRSWLNEDFYNTAFNEYQKSIIDIVTIDNSARSTNLNNNSAYWNNGENNNICPNTQDSIWLLSEQEVTNLDLGFEASPAATDVARQKKTSAYSKCMGVYVFSGEEYDGNGYWWLRSPHCSNDDCSWGVYKDGSSYSYYYDNDTSRGVVPALQIVL